MLSIHINFIILKNNTIENKHDGRVKRTFHELYRTHFKAKTIMLIPKIKSLKVNPGPKTFRILAFVTKCARPKGVGPMTKVTRYIINLGVRIVENCDGKL